jgi:invasion protein IalB
MKQRNASTATAVCRALAAIALAALAAVVIVPSALAQQAATKAQSKDRPKGEPKAAPTPAPPQQQPPELVYAPWTKICQAGQGANAKRVCFVGKDGRVESGMAVVAAVVVETEGEAKKLLRVTLPLGMSLRPGTRVIVDEGQPVTAPYAICLPNGCIADYEASDELIARMKKGQSLFVQGINSAGQPISLALPLADFAKAYDGKPTDPKVLEEQQKKLQDELQKRADDVRKKLEGQQAPTR